MDEIVKNPIRRKTEWNDLECAPEMVGNILAKLPVKNILTCKAVSKLWDRITNCAGFKKQQLLYSKENPTYLIYPYMSSTTHLYLADSDGTICGRVSIPRCDGLSSLTIVSSHNGLICFVTHPWARRPGGKKYIALAELDIRICNPATREVKLLRRGTPSDQPISVGVAHGPGFGDYKVYRFFYAKVEPCSQTRTFCEVYSTRDQRWRLLGTIQYGPKENRHVFVNGSVYWLVAALAEPHQTTGVLAVDSDSDRFRFIPVPEEVRERTFLVDIDGRLGLIAVYEFQLLINVWVLDEAEQVVWDRKHHDDVPFGSMVFVESVAVKDGVFFFISADHYFLYDPKLSVWWERTYDNFFRKIFPVVFPYTQSLLPCDGSLGAGVEGSNAHRA